MSADHLFSFMNTWKLIRSRKVVMLLSCKFCSESMAGVELHASNWFEGATGEATIRG